MHIPDNFLDPKTALVTSALAAGAVGLALHRAQRDLPPARVPLLGLGAAFIFAAQMINFPVVAGTSGHLVGGVLVASLLGPAAAVVVMTAVLVVQCFLFADGGVTALGANILNMGVVGAVGGWCAAQAVVRLVPGMAGRVAAVAFGGWFSMVLAAAACACELAASGTVRLSLALPALTGIHALIGLGEGLISALVFSTVARLRPELLSHAAPVSRSGRARDLWTWGLTVSFALAVLLAPWASSWPDGLEKVAEHLGFADRATAHLPAPMPDYSVPGMSHTVLTVALAGVTGTLVVLVLALLLGRWLVRPASGLHAGQPAPQRRTP